VSSAGAPSDSSRAKTTVYPAPPTAATTPAATSFQEPYPRAACTAPQMASSTKTAKPAARAALWTMSSLAKSSGSGSVATCTPKAAEATAKTVNTAPCVTAKPTVRNLHRLLITSGW
jgi:hypothetical protein